MKILLALVVSCMAVMGANPSFQQFNTNDFFTVNGVSVALKGLSNIVFVSKSGSDSTGQKGYPSRPFFTLSNAQAVATSGDTVYVFPGLYFANQLGKLGVNWNFTPDSCVVSNYANDAISNSWLSIFSDANDATNYSVSGRPLLVWHNGTNFDQWVGTTNVGTFRPNQCGSSNALVNGYGAIYTTNPASRLTFDLKRVELYGFNPFTGASGSGALVSGFHNINGNVIINADDVLDMTYDTNANFMLYTQPNAVTRLFPGGASMGIWRAGNATYNVKHWGRTRFYNMWGEYPTNNVIVTNDCWINSDFSEGRFYNAPIGGTPGYTNAYLYGNTWRFWYNIRQAENRSITPSIGCFLHYAGFAYITGSEKILATGTTAEAAVDVLGDAGIGGPNNTTLWIDAEKVSSANYGLRNRDGRVIGRISHFEDITTNQTLSGIWMGPLSGGIGGVAVTELSGELIQNTNSVPVTHKGGTNRLNGFKISTLGSLNIPVMVYTNGLTLQNCILLANAGTNCISATNLQTVAVLSVGATGTTNNINLSPNGGITVDANWR